MRSAVLIGNLLLWCFVTGCGGQRQQVRQRVLSGDAAGGKISVAVVDQRRREHYYQYEIRPSRGTVVLTGEETFEYLQEPATPESKEPSGAIYDCFMKFEPTYLAKSPDGKYVAACKQGSWRTPIPGIPGAFSYKYFEIFSVTQVESGKEVFQWKLDDGRRIHGFTWSPNSRSVAVLNSTQRVGKGPLETIWTWAGHPVPHHTVYLNVIPVDTMQPIQYEIRGDVLYARAKILDWSPE